MSTLEALTLTYCGPIATENSRLAPGGRRMIAGEHYRAAKDAMIMTFRSQVAARSQPVFPKGRPLWVHISARVPVRMDHHGVLKMVLDAMEAAGVYANDRDVVHSQIHRSKLNFPRSKTGAVVVEVRDYSEHYREDRWSDAIMDNLQIDYDIVNEVQDAE
jgi:Holliday junction resolvase RusA-like endonuclease